MGAGLARGYMNVLTDGGKVYAIHYSNPERSYTGTGDLALSSYGISNFRSIVTR